MERINERKTRLRTAATIIEVLVAMSIGGLLISLFLPSILRVRESARRMECLTRLGELAKAAAAYESTNNYLPSNEYIGQPLYPTVPVVQSSWVPLLPFIGQESLFQSVDMSALESRGCY